MDCIFKINSIDRSLVHWEDHLLDLTPVEEVAGVYFKREDAFAPLGLGGINGGKLRQLIWLFSRERYAGVVSGAVVHSPQLVMVAACAKHWNIPCIQLIGGRPESSLKHEMVRIAVELGAKTVFCNPGYAATLYSKAREISRNGLSGYLHVETNITLEHKTNRPERVEAFHRIGSEQVRNIPDHIENLLIPAGSCNTLTSILYGLGRFKPKSLRRVILFRIMKNADKHRAWTNERLDIIRKVTGDPLPLPYEFSEYKLVDDGYCTYQDLMPFSYKGLHAHPRYEGKCLNYIEDNVAEFSHLLNNQTLFWIIGSEPR